MKKDSDRFAVDRARRAVKALQNGRRPVPKWLAIGVFIVVVVVYWWVLK